MSYSIKAYKGKKALRIKVEEKHKYFNSPGYISWNAYDATAIDEYATQYNFSTIHTSNSFTLTRGPTSSNLIGDKVHLNKIDYTICLYVNSAALTDEIPHGDNFDFWEKCRLMVVHFDSVMDNTALANWFKTSYIYYYLVGDDAAKPAQSVHQNRLRESSLYTGRFKILYDLSIELSKQQSVKQLSFSLTPNKDITFDSNGNVVNTDFKNTYFFLIGPINYKFDVDARTTEMTMRAQFNQNNIINISYNANIKYTYYDLN